MNEENQTDTPDVSDASGEKRRSIRSFVLRQGRFTDAQKRAFDEQWPRFGRQIADGPFELANELPQCQRCVLEIGFGMGYTLAELAMRDPATAYIGVEVHRPGVGKLLALLNEQGIDNVRVYNEDAVEVLEKVIPENSLDGLLLFFPDPWHKKRHNKRRIVQPAFAQLVRSRLKPGGEFHLATDWENYAEHMLEVMDAAEGFSNTAGPGGFVERPSSRPETRFEQRGLRLGHGVWDLIYRREN